RGVEATYQKENLLWGGDNFMISGAFTGDRVDGNGVGHTGASVQTCTNTSPANCSSVNNSIDDERTQILGRVAYRVYSDAPTNTNIQIGASAAQILSLNGVAPGGAHNLQLRERPEIRVSGERFVDTGNIPIEGALAYGFEAAAQFQNFWIG